MHNINPQKKLKVLVHAYACSPVRGTEYGVGWGWVNCISKYHDLWIITGEHSKADIEAELKDKRETRCGMKFFYIPRKRNEKIEKIWPPDYLRTYQNQWQKDAFKLGEKLHKEINFDIVHQLTYVGYRVPGYLWKLDVPFVWGPIGGLENTHWKLLLGLDLNGIVYYGLRNIYNSLEKRLSHLPRQAFKKADKSVIAATRGIAEEIKQWYGNESTIICEVGLPMEPNSKYNKRVDGEPLKLAWSGQHKTGKALPLLIESLSKLPGNIDWELNILGDGPCTNKWRKLARKLNIHQYCHWHGWVQRNEALTIMGDAHAFIITSIKDLTSSVLLEALGLGLPVITPDHCGFSDVVDKSCGIKLRTDNISTLKKDLIKAIGFIDGNESLRRKLASGALTRVKEFSWENKAYLVDRIYRHAVEK